MKRKLAALGLIYEDAQQREAGTPERASLLAEFLARSSEFLTENGDVPQLWLLRASVALELNRAREGWESGRALIRLGYENSADQTVQNLFVQLERRNWLGEQPPAGAVATRPVAAPFSPED